MRDDFCAFILSHGRPGRVYTYDNLRRSGYTGKIYIVIDDEDETAGEYRRRFGNEVLQFCKAEVAKTTDDGDNFGIRGVVYARNVCWDLARQVGCTYFIQLDDDYNSGFYLRFNSRMRYGYTHRIADSLDEILTAIVDFFVGSGAVTIALSQGGDHIGGDCSQRPRLTRKAMNSFICSRNRPFKFIGHINEDVNAYTLYGRMGYLFFTTMQAQVNQLATQSNAGGLTEFYLDVGTYIKSFYSVMYAPSCVKIGQLSDPRSPHVRIHHKINWHHAVPKILDEKYKR